MMEDLLYYEVDTNFLPMSILVLKPVECTPSRAILLVLCHIHDVFLSYHTILSTRTPVSNDLLTLLPGSKGGRGWGKETIR